MEATPPPLAVARTLHVEAAQRLREMIVQGLLAPGTKLNERELCEQLGVSRTPLREAIRSLAAEALVEIRPNRGAIVAPLTLDTVRDVFEVLSALEALAGVRACERASDADLAEIQALHFEMLACHARRDLSGYFRLNQQIHLAIVSAGGNPVLAQTYRSLNDQVKRARYLANLSRERWDQAVAEHEDMLDALLARDAERLQAVLSRHLSRRMLVVLEALGAESPDLLGQRA